MTAPTTRETADHAELARIEALLREHIRVDASGLAPAVVSHFVFGFDTAASALLSEIAALRVDRDEWRNWYRKASVEINEQTDRATQAERQRDEAVGHMSWMRIFVPTVYGSTEERLQAIDAFLANQGADQ